MPSLPGLTPWSSTSTAGGSGTFLALGSDKAQWWVKPPNNQQGGKVVVTEYIVAQCGRLIEAPVCEGSVIRIPAEGAGWEFRPGVQLVEGYGHASRAVDSAREGRTLDARDRDDNRRRHAGILALFDWCWGGDGQWLYSEAADRTLYSHDHGWYLPEEGADWSEATLLARLNEPHPHPSDPSGLDPAELHALADRLRGVDREILGTMLQGVPLSWPVTDEELEACGYFLEFRSGKVAERLEAIAGGLAP
jgi:hypothetical protein